MLRRIVLYHFGRQLPRTPLRLIGFTTTADYFTFSLPYAPLHLSRFFPHIELTLKLRTCSSCLLFISTFLFLQFANPFHRPFPFLFDCFFFYATFLDIKIPSPLSPPPGHLPGSQVISNLASFLASPRLIYLELAAEIKSIITSLKWNY